ncbi:hypothetical protein evm_004890 [Chilo suppressalis]|nr:hypothetical protein evm_004890 [Chilo suppressalis]
MTFHYSLFVYLFILFTKCVFANVCKFDVKLTQTLHNEGFHRNITYGVVFNEEDVSEDWINRDCIIALDQKLPPGVYVNPDELGELRRTNKLNALPKNRVNVELPTEQSDDSSVYIIGLVSESKVYLWVPIHARYHKAVAGGGMAKNEIEPPKMYLRCPDRRLDMCGKTISPSVTFLCNGSSREQCSWKEIPFTMMTSTLVWEVPIGNLDHYYAVAFGTVLAILSGSMYLLKAIHAYKMRKLKRA